MKLMYDSNNLLPNVEAVEKKVLEMERINFILTSLPQQQLRDLSLPIRHQVNNSTTQTHTFSINTPNIINIYTLFY